MIYLEHPLIKKDTLEKREYQINIAKKIVETMKNTLVVLPTGIGKTEIGIIVIAEFLQKFGPKVLFLAPTRPLVLQHVERLKKYLIIDKIVGLTGNIKAQERKKLWDENDVIVSTPQVIQNDILSSLIDISKVRLLIVDEAHRSVGKYSYTFVTERAVNAVIVGMTASPGSKMERLQEIIRNLNVKQVEMRTERDEDVREYVKGVKVESIKIDFPLELEPLRMKLHELLDSLLELLKQKYENTNINKKITKKMILDLQKEALEKINTGDKSFFEALSITSMMLKIYIAIEFLETQGIESCHEYLEKLVASGRMKNARRVDVRLNKLKGFQEAVLIARDLVRMNIKSPKIEKIKEIVKEQLSKNPKSKIIVFTNYRKVNEKVYEELKKIEIARPSRFLGQSTREGERGMTQEEQEEILKKFRSGEINVLVSTQIGEEGLDIPETDLVIFHEPVSSEIRNIQRRGRTGRLRPGRAVILVYKDTMDEIMFYSGIMKEKKMKEKLKTIVPEERPKKKGQYSIFDF